MYAESIPGTILCGIQKRSIVDNERNKKIKPGP